MAEPLRLEYLDPAELAANPRNYRRHPKAQVDALKGALAQVGWAGALLFNERTGRLIDGHARREVTPPGEKVPVLVGSWSEADEAVILATLDPLAAMALADAPALDALLKSLTVNDQALSEMLARLAEDTGLGDEGDWADAAALLPSGERAPFQQMTFTLSDAQAETVKRAIKAAQAAESFTDTGNENSNGNALAALAESYLG